MLLSPSRRAAAFLLVALFSAASRLAAQNPPPWSIPKTNPPAKVVERIGGTDVEISYSRPSRRGRTIFGALVPWGEIWRTGADAATKVRFSTAVKLEGIDVPAGEFELFTIPDPDAWTVILQPDRSRWGAYDYDPALDVARFAVRPSALSEPIETFTISLAELTGHGALLTLAWEHLRVPIRVEVDVVAHVVPRIDSALAEPGKRPYFSAAMFYFEHGLDLDKAESWMRAALADHPGHIGMLHRLALILEKKGDLDGARRAAKASLEGASTAAPNLRAEYTRLNSALLARLGSD